MPKVYTAAERAAWMKTLPSKRVGGFVALYNAVGEVLIQNPSYRDRWIFPGGVIEAGESPLSGALREVGEELSLIISADRISFEGAFYIPEHHDFPDFFNIIFSTKLSDDEIRKIRLNEIEITDYKFVPIDKLGDYMPEYEAKNNKMLLEDNQAVYTDMSVDGIRKHK